MRLLTIFILSWTLLAPLYGKATSSYGLSKLGPRFEGWYARISDRDGKRSIALIVGSFLETKIPFSPHIPMPGYLAILVSDGVNELKVYETFPNKTSLTINEEATFNENPIARCGPWQLNICSNFSWDAPGFGHIDNESFDLTIPGEINFSGNFSNPIYWMDNPLKTPEGMATHLQVIPIHWYVHSLGSISEYSYQIDQGPTIHSSGYAHIEKNWGKSFPSRWIWSEGISDDNKAHYALAGGEVKMAGVNLTAFLAGIHTSKIKWDFRPQQGTLFKSIINGRRRTLSLIMAKPGKQLVIESSAPKKSFAYVSIPTANGFVKNGGIESFLATTSLYAYEVDVSGKATLVESKIFNNAALEFGANYMYEEQ